MTAQPAEFVHKVTIPANSTGELIWDGKRLELQSGMQELTLP